MKCIHTQGTDEYRIFKSLTSNNDEEYHRNDLVLYRSLYNNCIEERIDFYIFPLNLDIEKSFNYGIKFRNVGCNEKGHMLGKKLELKIRLNNENGLEKWVKPISINIEKVKLLKKIKHEVISDEGYYVMIDNSLYIVNVIDIIDCIKNKFSLFNVEKSLIDLLNIPLGFGITYKNRTQINGEDAIFKLTTFRIDSLKKEINLSKNHYKRSFCVEGLLTSKDIDFIKSKTESNDLIAGYPEIILKLI